MITNVAYYHEAQEIAAENVPLIYTTLGERIVAVRNVLRNTTPTSLALGHALRVPRRPMTLERW